MTRGRWIASNGHWSPPGWSTLRLPAHRASSATLAGAYPFLAGPLCQVGSYVGTDAISGEPFGFDPWDCYTAGKLTNPNVALAGVIGAGKSALAKSLALRAVAAGRTAYVPGDPKGEWAPLATLLGGDVLRLGPGQPTRLNPLDLARHSGAHDHRAGTLAAVAAVLLGVEPTPAQRAALDAAVDGLRPDAVLGDVVDALVDPDAYQARDDGLDAAQRAADGREIAHALRRLLRGDLAGMFGEPSTVTLNPRAPMIVLDLSAIGSDDTAMAVAMTCASAWLESSLAASSTSGAAPSAGRWVIYDEAWRLLRAPALVRRMQAQWKLSRAHGIANLLVLHRLSDLDAVGAAGSEARALAGGLLADCSTRVMYRQESDQLAATGTALDLTDTERALLPNLPRGCGLWKMPGSAHLVHHRLHEEEIGLYDTDAAIRAVSAGPPGALDEHGGTGLSS